MENINIEVTHGTIALDFTEVPDGWEVVDFWPLGENGSEGVVLSFGPPEEG